MPTIQQYFEFAQLAQASYALLESGLSESALTTEGGFSTSQATSFRMDYTLRSHQPDTVFNGDFSASVFQNNASGEYTLAIRGTAGILGDIIGADLFKKK